MYYDKRWYDVGTGQFISADPIQYDTSNTYRHVGNSPTNATDPTGLVDIWYVDDDSIISPARRPDQVMTSDWGVEPFDFRLDIPMVASGSNTITMFGGTIGEGS